jgi:hypothetical protein
MINRRLIVWMPCLLIACMLVIAPLAMADSATDSQVASRTDSLKWAVQDLQARLQALQARIDALSPQTSSASLLDDPSLLAGRNGAVYVLPHATPMAQPPEPQEPSVLEQSKVEISGYLDGVYSVSPRNGTENRAALHQVDIDLARDVTDRAAVGLTVYYDQSLYIAAATISYAAYKADLSAGGSAPFLSEWSAQAGQFDIPFGLDYQVYTSIARNLITMPAAVAQTHGGWNDAGLMNTITTKIGSLNLFAVKGFESRVWRGSLPVAVDPNNENWALCQPSVSGGARLNFAFIPGLEYGGSVAQGWSNGQPAMLLAGVHAKAGWKALSVKAEGLYLRKGESICPELVRGSYAESMETLGKFYLIQRYDYVDPDILPIQHFVSAGAGIHIGDNLVCRGEYRLSTDTSTPQLFFQVAAGF